MVTESEKQETRLQWRLRLIRHLFFFSSVDLVSDAWLKGIQHLGWGWFPAEDCCAWFDDLNMKAGTDWALQEGRINKSEYLLIVSFHEAFRKVCDVKESNTTSILASAAMSRLTEEGEQVCLKLPHVIKGDAEIELVQKLTKSAAPFWLSNRY